MRNVSAGGGERRERERESKHPGRGSCRWKDTEVQKNIGVKDSDPSTWREKRYMVSVIMTQTLTTSLDVMAICSCHRVYLSSLKFPEAIRTNNKVSNE